MESNSDDSPLEYLCYHPYFWKASEILDRLLAVGIQIRGSKGNNVPQVNRDTKSDSKAEATTHTTPGPKGHKKKRKKERKKKYQRKRKTSWDYNADVTENTIKKSKNETQTNPATYLNFSTEASEYMNPGPSKVISNSETNPAANLGSDVEAYKNKNPDSKNDMKEAQIYPDTNIDLDAEANENSILGLQNNWKYRLDEVDKQENQSEDSNKKENKAEDSKSTSEESKDLINTNSSCYYLTTDFSNGGHATLENLLKRKEFGNKKQSLSNEEKKKLEEKLAERTSRLSELLICIRNKLAHPTDLPKLGQERLGFISPNTNKFDTHGFVQKIITGFPSLVAFLAIKKGSEEHLQDLYKYRNTLKWHANDFLDKIETALQEHSWQGRLEKRYTTNDSTKEVILEFRILEFRTKSGLRLPSNTTTMAAVIGDEEMKIIWSKHNETEPLQLTYALSNKSQVKLSRTAIIFTKEAEKVDCEFIQKHCAGKKRIIVLAEKVGNIKEVVDKINSGFVEAHIEWKEVEDMRKKYGLTQNVQFHDFQIPLEFFIAQADFETKILNSLKGDELNEVLRDECRIFDKCEVPERPEIYLPRTLLEKATLITDCVKTEKDIFIVCGASYDEVSNWFQNMTQLCIDIKKEQQEEILKSKFLETVSENTKVFVIEEGVESSRKIFDAIKQHGRWKNYNIHCLEYAEKNRLIQVESIGNKLTGNLKAQNNCFTEDKLVDEISKKARAVMIADQPGMGKTYLMKSLANKLAAKNPDSDCALLNIETFVQVLGKKSKTSAIELDKDRIINALTELMCTSTFKKQIAKMWLNESVSGKLKMDVLFDGLDEATSESRATLIQALKLINEQIPTIRVWVAMREHVHQDVQNFKNVVHVKIMPFSEHDEIDCIEKELWKYKLAKIESSGKILSAKEEEKERWKIKKFSENCTPVKVFENDVDIAGIPLQCYIISQVYAERVLANNFTLNENVRTTIAQLYNGLIYRKFWIYLRKIGFNASEEKPEGQFFKDNYRRMLHQLIYYALKLIISEKVASWFQKTIHLEISKSEEYTSDILSYGLIESIEPLQFVHRTFAEFLVAMFFYFVLTVSFDSRIQKQDTYFQEVLSEEILQFNTRDLFKITDFKYPNVARFLEQCLAESMNQADVYPHESYPSMLANVRSNLTNERVTLAMSYLLYDKIEPKHFGVKNHKELSKYFEIKISKLNFSQLLLVVGAENKDDDFCGKFRFYLKNKLGDHFRIFPKMWTENIFECVALTFVNNRNLFLVHPTSETEEVLKSVVDIYSKANDLRFVYPMVYSALNVIISDGDFNQNLIEDWVDFFLTKLIPSSKVKCEQTLLPDLTKNAINLAEENEIIPKHNSEFKKSLVENGGLSRSNETPFHSGIKSFGDLINEKDSDGNTLLLLAANNKTCTAELIRKLKELGGDVNTANKWGKTCLMLAVKNNRLGIVESLFELGANAKSKDKNGNSAVAYVTPYVSSECSVGIMECMIKYNVDIATQNSDGENVLHIASKHHNLNLVRFLVERIMDNKLNMSLDQKDKSGKTALHHAVPHLFSTDIYVSRGTRGRNNNNIEVEVALELIKARPKMKKCFVNATVIKNIATHIWEMKKIVVAEHKYSVECNCDFHLQVRDIENEKILGADDVKLRTLKEKSDYLNGLIYRNGYAIHILYMAIKKIVLESEYRISYDRLYELWKKVRRGFSQYEYHHHHIFSEIKKKSSHCKEKD